MILIECGTNVYFFRMKQQRKLNFFPDHSEGRDPICHFIECVVSEGASEELITHEIEQTL